MLKRLLLLVCLFWAVPVWAGDFRLDLDCLNEAYPGLISGTETDAEGRVWFLTSGGERLPYDDGRVKTPAELYKEGEEIQAKIIHVSAEDRRLGLSIKQLKDEEERKKPREYSRSGPEAGQSLGDLLKQKFEEGSDN